jgi:serine/threonine-protein kinase PRP4
VADIVPETGAPVSTSPAVVIAANVGQAKTNLDFDTVAAKAPLIAGGPPTMSGISDSEKNQAQAGLGEGSPKSERSADMFHDDIFGESPAGIRKVVCI